MFGHGIYAEMNNLRREIDDLIIEREVHELDSDEYKEMSAEISTLQRRLYVMSMQFTVDAHHRSPSGGSPHSGGSS